MEEEKEVKKKDRDKTRVYQLTKTETMENKKILIFWENIYKKIKIEENRREWIGGIKFVFIIWRNTPLYAQLSQLLLHLCVFNGLSI